MEEVCLKRLPSKVLRIESYVPYNYHQILRLNYMIYQAFNCLQQELNHYLMRKFQLQDEKAILGPVFEESDNVSEAHKNKVIMSMTNFAHEKNAPYATQMPATANSSAQSTPRNFNVDLLTTAMFDDYKESLKFLSEVLYFFQEKPRYTQANSPGLASEIHRINIEILETNYQELQSLWNTMGAHYMPSVLYRVRIAGAFDMSEVTPSMPTISAEPR
jgi:hypothetical protein